MEVPLGMPKKNKTGRNCSKQFFAAPAVICHGPEEEDEEINFIFWLCIWESK